MKYTFDTTNLKRILKGALIAGGGALIIYLLESLSTLDFGSFTPLVVALASVGINIVREYLRSE